MIYIYNASPVEIKDKRKIRVTTKIEETYFSKTKEKQL